MYKTLKLLLCRGFGHKTPIVEHGPWESDRSRSVWHKCPRCQTVLFSDVEQNIDEYIRSRVLGG